MRVAIAGAGRMGQAIANQIAAADGIELAGIWRRGGDLGGLLESADVLIDFSLPEGTAEILSVNETHRIPLVCGVSGLSDGQLDAIRTAAMQTPVVYDRNMSLGVAVLTRSVAEAAAALGPEFRVHISETHHVHKKDAPSGTALKLGEAAASARGKPGTGDTSFESERRGEVPGDHEVIFTSESETLRLAHSVTTRDVFAAGAIRAARWVVGQKPGLYGMQDVLFSELG